MSDFANDRFKRAISAFIRELFPTLDYFGLYTYVVVNFDVSNQVAELLPEDNKIGLPALPRIPTRMPGIILDLDIGTTVMVGFENHDPSKPYIAFYDKLAGGGFVPSFTGLGGALPTDVAPVGSGVARIGDVAGPYTILTGSPKVFSR